MTKIDGSFQPHRQKKGYVGGSDSIFYDNSDDVTSYRLYAEGNIYYQGKTLFGNRYYTYAFNVSISTSYKISGK